MDHVTFWDLRHVFITAIQRVLVLTWPRLDRETAGVVYQNYSEFLKKSLKNYPQCSALNIV